MDKKAIILYTMLKLVVSTAVLIILFAIIFNIVAIFISPELSQGTSVSFDAISNTANRLVAGDPELKSSVVQFDIDNPLVMFGFDMAVLSETCATDEVILRPLGAPPKGCDNKPCFCICDEDDNCKKPVECKILNESVKSIRAKAGISGHSLGGDYGEGRQSVAFFGDCGTRSSEWQVTALKLEFDSQKGELMISKQ
jgi:hypothetical protein